MCVRGSYVFPKYSPRLLTSMIGNLNGAQRRSQQKPATLIGSHTNTNVHAQLNIHDHSH